MPRGSRSCPSREAWPLFLYTGAYARSLLPPAAVESLLIAPNLSPGCKLTYPRPELPGMTQPFPPSNPRAATLARRGPGLTRTLAPRIP